jgi:DNA-binding LytR/AlgR family response regulator
VREIQPWFSGDYVAVLHNGEQLRVGRHYRDDILKPSF